MNLGDLFMIIYGVKVFNKIIGYFGEVHECDNCHKKYKSGILKTKKWIHIMFIPLIPIGTSYKKICPICYKQEKLTKKEAKELMKFPDNSGQNIKTYIIHHSGNKNGYEIWVEDLNSHDKSCVLANLNKWQINNFKKNMGLKNVNIEEVE